VEAREETIDNVRKIKEKTTGVETYFLMRRKWNETFRPFSAGLTDD